MEKEISAVENKLNYNLYSWCAVESLINPSTGDLRELEDPMEAAEALSGLPERSILVLKGNSFWIPNFCFFRNSDSPAENKNRFRLVKEKNTALFSALFWLCPESDMCKFTVQSFIRPRPELFSI